MRTLVVSLLIGLVTVSGAAQARAHPPHRIVVDTDGNIYFSTLSDVRMITRDGSVRVLIPDVHTHTMRLDENGCLIGEDVEDVAGGARHMVWRKCPNGNVETALPWRNGYPGDYDDYSFDCAPDGTCFRPEQGSGNGVLHVLPSDESDPRYVVDVGEGVIGRGFVVHDGYVFSRAGDLLMFRERGEPLAVIARNLIVRTSEFDHIGDRHAISGGCRTEGGVLMAILSGQRVLRLSGGTVDTVYESEGQWSPSAVHDPGDGTLVIQEASSERGDRTRMVRFDRTTGERTVLAQFR